jgi:hypothetical protein
MSSAMLLVSPDFSVTSPCGSLSTSLHLSDPGTDSMMAFCVPSFLIRSTISVMFMFVSLKGVVCLFILEDI